MRRKLLPMEDRRVLSQYESALKKLKFWKDRCNELKPENLTYLRIIRKVEDMTDDEIEIAIGALKDVRIALKGEPE